MEEAYCFEGTRLGARAALACNPGIARYSCVTLDKWFRGLCAQSYLTGNSKAKVAFCPLSCRRMKAPREWEALLVLGTAGDWQIFSLLLAESPFGRQAKRQGEAVGFEPWSILPFSPLPLSLTSSLHYPHFLLCPFPPTSSCSLPLSFCCGWGPGVLTQQTSVDPRCEAEFSPQRLSPMCFLQG